MALQFKAIKGTSDILPDEAKVWQYIEETARRVFNMFGYGQIRTPLFEETGLFARSIGEATDIVQKQMYSFEDRAGRSMTLRPEGTAPVIRAFLENRLDKEAGICKLYYIGPMFRSERPQKGRRRQFHQLGVEAIGSESPYLDVEVISLLMNLLKEVLGEGADDSCLKINSVGCSEDRKVYSKILEDALSDKVKLMCKDCQYRYDQNIFRILDCKHEDCQKIISQLPVYHQHLCQDCTSHFEMVKAGLESVNIKFSHDPYLVRGLDYYSQTAFEISHPLLGGQDAVAAGGRYDNLIAELGGPELGAVGFALGIERLVLIAQAAGLELDSGQRLNVFIVTMDDRSYKHGFSLLAQLRQAGISADIDYEGKGMKPQMKMAAKLKAQFAVILGQEELDKKTVTLKNMDKGEQEQIPESELVNRIKE